MHRRLVTLSIAAWFAAGLGGSTSVVAATPPGEDAAKARPAHGSPREGLWPTDRLAENLLRRVVRENGREFDLSQAQVEELEKRAVQRWMRWLKRNRDRLQPLLNEWLERRFSPEEPDPDEVKQWAQRAREVFESFRQEMYEYQDEDFRPLLDERQRMRFDLKVAQMRAAGEFAAKKLEAWAQGHYRPKEIWDVPKFLPPAVRQEFLKAQDHRDLIFTPVDKWEAYVVDFINRYELDEAQANAAFGYLDDIRERAQAHLRKTRAERLRIDKTLRTATGEERDTLLMMKRELDREVQQYFEELQKRLEQLLTPAQRRRAQADRQAHAGP